MPSKSKSLKKPASRTFLMTVIEPSLRAKYAKYAAKKGTTMSADVRAYVEKVVSK